MAKTGGKQAEANRYRNQGNTFYFLGEHGKAKEYLEKALAIRKEIGDRKGEGSSYGNLGTVFSSLGEYGKAKEYLEKALAITKEIGDRKGEAAVYGNLGTVFQSLGEYGKAKEYLEKALAIRKEIGDRKGEGSSYGNLGTVFQSFGEYGKAKEYHEKALAIRKEIGDRKGEAAHYENLGTVFTSLGEYGKAKEYLEKALAIRKEIDDRKGEGSSYGNLGAVFRSLGEYGKAKEYLEKALAITKEIGDRKGEAAHYGNLGTVFTSLGEYGKAKEYLEKALAIRKEIGDRKGEGSSYGNLGTVFSSLGEYGQAKEYLEKALAITKEIGDRKGEAAAYGNLGTVFTSLGEYGKAKEYLEKALAIGKEIGDRKGEAADYGNLGTVFQSLGEYGKAKEYLEKALAITKEIGDRKGEAAVYGNLGTVFQSLGEYGKAKEYDEKALAIGKEIGDRKGEAADYGNLGTVFQSLGEYGKAKEYHEKALAIRKEIGDRKGEAADYGNLGTLFSFLGEYGKSKEYLYKAVSISKEIGNVEQELRFHAKLSICNMFLEGNIYEAFLNLRTCVNKFENIRSLLKDNDEFKVLFSDEHAGPFELLSTMLCNIGKPSEALHVVEFRRARALADLMSAQYCLSNQVSSNPPSRVGIERIMAKESDCACLYISYFSGYIFLWILKLNKPTLFRKLDVNAHCIDQGSIRNLDTFFGNDITFRKFHILPAGNCEDRSLFPSNGGQLTRQSSQEDNSSAFRLVEDDDEENQEPEPSLSLYYKLIIAPVADLLDVAEIIIVPDRSLYNVPFAALKDESGGFLSETFRIRIVPSLSTLKLIQDCPADYHSQTGALIVGDPEVGDVIYKGGHERFGPLPCARQEAEMIGRLFDSQPLLGKQATKQEVLQRMHSVGLIHFAAHGSAERGEIALAPIQPTDRIPREEDFLLTMSDISNVRLRAKLVVLSCCHSGRGEVRAEGVVGIARAFLGSGARSVLVSLWAIPDSATEQLMCRFYEHLVRGESASESLHQAMKWMRSNGYYNVRDWAPFMLIGDNVKFDFDTNGKFFRYFVIQYFESILN